MNGEESENREQDEIDALLEQAGVGEAGSKSPEGTEAASSVTQDDIDSLLQQAGVSSGEMSVGAPAEGAQSFELEQFESSDLSDEKKLDLLMDVSLDVQVVLGQAKMQVEQIIRLKSGSVVELDKLAGDPLDVLVNGKLVARGEVLVLNDNFCVRITEILSPEARVEVEGAR